MFEQPQHNLEPGPSDIAEHTDSITINEVPLHFDWSIDVDSPDLKAVYVDDGSGDDIRPLLSANVLLQIANVMNKRMDEMKRETAAWRGQYNNV